MPGALLDGVMAPLGVMLKPAGLAEYVPPAVPLSTGEILPA